MKVYSGRFVHTKRLLSILFSPVTGTIKGDPCCACLGKVDGWESQDLVIFRTWLKVNGEKLGGGGLDVN